jgi:hypothetical protein
VKKKQNNALGGKDKFGGRSRRDNQPKSKIKKNIYRYIYPPQWFTIGTPHLNRGLLGGNRIGTMSWGSELWVSTSALFISPDNGLSVAINSRKYPEDCLQTKPEGLLATLQQQL